MSFLSGFRWEECKAKSANRKLYLFTLNNVLGASEHRGYDFTTVTSQGFKYNVLKEKREADTNLCFPKCQEECTVFSSLIPLPSFPGLFYSTVQNKQVPLSLMAGNVTLMFSKCQGFLLFDGGAI